MVQAVQKNFEEYNKKQVEKAILSRKVQAMIDRPTKNKFNEMVVLKLLTNSPVIIGDITNTHNIFGPQRSVIGG